MIRAFFASRHWWLFAYGGGAALLASLYYQVHFSVLINSWYGSFYNLLQEAAKHNVSELWEGIEAFLWLAIPYVLLAAITGYRPRSPVRFSIWMVRQPAGSSNYQPTAARARVSAMTIARRDIAG